MVRLKEIHAASFDAYFTDFNSTMVRLKVRTGFPAPVTHGYFNSTMVRLKALTSIQRQRSIKFQFHYGTIKSLHKHDKVNRANGISIPLWYD